ncbi:MAG: hypothetical protein QXP36_05955 [Conexivisphaerales archaeon]
MSIEVKTIDDIRKFSKPTVMGLPLKSVIVMAVFGIAGILGMFVLHLPLIVNEFVFLLGGFFAFIVSSDMTITIFYAPKLFLYVSSTYLEMLEVMNEDREEEA